MKPGRRSDGFGPFRPDLDDRERAQRLRDLRTVAHVMLGGKHFFVRSLIAAELGEAGALDRAAQDLDALPALPMRRILSTYGEVSRVPAPKHFGVSGATDGAE
jgi:hypothetical protein